MKKQTEIKYTSDSGRTYTVKLNPGRGGYCTCPAWKFQHKSPKFRTCKHIAAIRKEMGSLLNAA